jgi:DNA-binding protein H-NS
VSTYKELKLQMEALQKQAEQVRQQEIQEMIAKIKSQMQEFGITLADLKAAGLDDKALGITRSNPSSPKYRGPNGETWVGGRGRKPDWALKVIEEHGLEGLKAYEIRSH